MFKLLNRICCYLYIAYFILLVRSQSMERTLEVPSPIPIHEVTELEWILSPEQSANTSIREEFRFEQVWL